MPEMTEFRVILAVSFPKHIHVFLFLQYFGDLEGFTIYVICSAFVIQTHPPNPHHYDSSREKYEAYLFPCSMPSGKNNKYP